MEDFIGILEHMKVQEKALADLMEVEVEQISKALKETDITTENLIALNESLLAILDRINELSSTTKEKYAIFIPLTSDGNTCPHQREEYEECNEYICHENSEDYPKDEDHVFCEDEFMTDFELHYDCNQCGRRGCYRNFDSCNEADTYSYSPRCNNRQREREMESYCQRYEGYGQRCNNYSQRCNVYGQRCNSYSQGCSSYGNNQRNCAFDRSMFIMRF